MYLLVKLVGLNSEFSFKKWVSGSLSYTDKIEQVNGKWPVVRDLLYSDTDIYLVFELNSSTVEDNLYLGI